MNEAALAFSLVELACAELPHFGRGARITDLRVRLGRGSGVVQETLLFAFTLAAEGSPIAGATLDIEDTPVEARCRHCESVLLVAGPSGVCPGCGAPALPAEGNDLQLVALGVAGPVARVSAGN
jgi:hydrogenase nickel incorporation protein HypA/HybF